MKKLAGVGVGDTLYDSGIRRDTRQNNKPRTLHVIKKGREYVYASQYKDAKPTDYSVEKISIKSGWVDGWMGYQIYLSEEDYKEREYRKELSKQIHAVFGSAYSVTVPDVTTEDLVKIATILGINK